MNLKSLDKTVLLTEPSGGAKEDDIGKKGGIWEEEVGKGANRWPFSQRQYQTLDPAPCIYQRITPFSGKFRLSFLSPNGEIEQ